MQHTIHVGGLYMRSTLNHFKDRANHIKGSGYSDIHCLSNPLKNTHFQRAGVFFILIFLFLSSSYAALPITQAIELQKSINKESAASQARIDKLADETLVLKNQYRELLLKIESTRSYNEYLQKLVDAHENKKQALNEQLSQVDDTNDSILPLMIRMIDTLEKFITLDMPFNLNERLDKVHKLKDQINDANISSGEKYRHIMDAYQHELGYGKTIGTYKGTLGDNDEKTVEFIRIGRIGWFYQTLDGSEHKYWNSNSRSWEDLPSEYNNSLLKARRIANKQQAPDLISLPVHSTKNTP